MHRMKCLVDFFPLITYIVIILAFELDSRTKDMIVFALLGVNFLAHLYIDKNRK
ncbi:hypothetical protein IZY60_03025 [Lutibacter sp. B2]|nr:hypothetical protein [Lutibacter sp. B2]